MVFDYDKICLNKSRLKKWVGSEILVKSRKSIFKTWTWHGQAVPLTSFLCVMGGVWAWHGPCQLTRSGHVAKVVWGRTPVPDTARVRWHRQPMLASDFWLMNMFLAPFVTCLDPLIHSLMLDGVVDIFWSYYKRVVNTPSWTFRTSLRCFRTSVRRFWILVK